MVEHRHTCTLCGKTLRCNNSQCPDPTSPTTWNCGAHNIRAFPAMARVRARVRAERRKKAAKALAIVALLLLSPLAHASSQRFDREMRQLVQDYRHHIHQRPIKDYASSLYRAKCDLDLLLLESALKRYERGGATQAQVEKVFDQLSRDTENTPPVAIAEVR